MLSILILTLIKFIHLNNIKIPFETYYHNKNKLNYNIDYYKSSSGIDIYVGKNNR